MRNAAFIGVVLIMCFTACAPKLVSRPGVAIRQLGVCVNYDVNVPEEMRVGFEGHLQSFISKYNSETHSIYLYSCEDTNKEALRLYIANTKVIGPQQQAAGLVITSLGLATPFVMAAAGAPFVLWFYYFPHNRSEAVVSLSGDLSLTESAFINREFSSWAFLVNEERQLAKHPRKFERFLETLLQELEQGQRKYRRQQRAVAGK